jgi:hypothetical protein
MTVPNLKSQNDEKVYVRKLRLNQGGYTDRGDYYGIGLPLYECWNNEIYQTFRADDRSHAIEQLRDCYRGQDIKVYREGN